MHLVVIGMSLSVLNLVQTAIKSGYTILVYNPFGNHLLKEIFTSKKKIKLVNLTKASLPEIIMLFIHLEKFIKQLSDMS
ncbi:hypothetical protein D3C85_1325520 [compost metagenome]